MTVERWAKTLSSVLPLGADIIALQEFHPLFPQVEACTAGMAQTYTLIPHQVSGPGVAFLIKNTITPQLVQTRRDDYGHALTLTLTSGQQSLKITNVYSKFSQRDKDRVDNFLMADPPDILMGDFNAPIWHIKPARPWQQWLANSTLIDPLQLLTPAAELRDMATRVGHLGNPKRIDAILVRSALHQISFDFYDTIDLPLSDHRLVMMGSTWSSERSASPPPLQPSVQWWGPKHFAAFIARMESFTRTLHAGSPIDQSAQLLHEIQRYAQCMHNIRHRKAPKKEPKASFGDQEALQKLVAKMRISAAGGTGFFYSLTKRWREGLLKTTRP